jgi:hypothetical protein
MGLMALHLLLLSFNKVKPQLRGLVHIYLDCLGALNKVEHLPPQRIPSRCRHSDILKNILVNCTSLSFKRHQDEKEDFGNLERPSQLNCVCDGEAKLNILQSDLNNLPRQRAFPLEPITLFVDNQKVTTESGPVIRFAAQRQEPERCLQREAYYLETSSMKWPGVTCIIHSATSLKCSKSSFANKSSTSLPPSTFTINEMTRSVRCAHRARSPGRPQATFSSAVKKAG